MYLILLALPYFGILILAEYLISRRKRRALFRLNDSIADVNMGILDRVVDAFAKTVILGLYVAVFHQFAAFEIGMGSVAAWVVCFILVDLCFYWAHRSCHHINFLWACHIVHHSSEEMNLTVALRQSATETLFTWVFYLPLAFLGFPPEMWFICFQINLLYQFLLHTQAVRRLGPLEAVMNTPSHHRVHHGVNEKYIDKNHGGTFIIWDRFFGTFQEEEEEVSYGIVTPLQSWNPIWGHVHYWVRLAQLSWRAPSWRDKIRVWYREPAYLPEGVEAPDGPSVRAAGYRKYDPAVPASLNRYVATQFAIAFCLLAAFMFVAEEAGWAQLALPAAIIVGTLVCIGGMLELRPWAFPAEIARLACIGGVVIAWGGGAFGLPDGGLWPRAAAFAGTVFCLYWFSRRRGDFAAAAAPALETGEEIPVRSGV